MPKKRRTRKQKILTDQKKEIVQEIGLSQNEKIQSTHSSAPQQNPQGATFSLPTTYSTATNPIKRLQTESVVISTTEYDYLGKDLMKTAVLTLSIVIAEVLIRLFFKG